MAEAQGRGRGHAASLASAAGLLAAGRAVGARTIFTGLEAPANLDGRDRFVQGRAAEVLPPLVAEILGTTES